MNQVKSLLQFAAWPVLSGILLALVIVQYQQLERLSALPASPSPVPAPSAPLSFAEAIQKATPSVVSINATRLDLDSIESITDEQLVFELEASASLGSGVIIDPRGFILTNFHVVDTLQELFATEVTLSDGRRVPGTVIAWNRDHDLAVIHVNMDDLTPIEIGDDRQLQVGDIVFAIGYPRNIGQSVSQGIISAITEGSDGRGAFLQTDAAINPGNSGGALIDASGRLVGINSSIFSESGTFEGIGFATPASIAVPAMRTMVDGAIDANSGYLGVITGEALDSQSSRLFFGVDHIRGMLVESVDDGGAAQRAGIQPGDVITQVGDTPVTDAESIIMEIRNKKPGDEISLRVYRDGREYEFPCTLGFGQAVILDI